MLLGVIALIAHSTTHNRPVFLFDIGVVILASYPTAGEGDLLLDAVPIELIVDEFGTTVRINAQQRER